MAEDQRIQFHYIKSNFFRVAHIDGAIGGLTPTGDLFISLYSQRGPIPVITVQEVQGNELGPEIMSERQSKKGIVREVEVGLAMRPDVARQLRNWLDEKIKLVEELEKQTSDPSKTEVPK